MAAAVVSRHQTQPIAPLGKTEGHFWRSTEYDEKYWDKYVAGRPQYRSNLYERIINYYREHNPSPSRPTIAHDVGTGPGQVAGELCKYFDRVIGSDPNETHTNVAAVRNINLKSQLEWANFPAESLMEHFPKGSANLVTAAQALGLLDVPRAIESFGHLLAPNGTLAVFFYGRPNFVDPDLAQVCQPLLVDLLNLIVVGQIDKNNEGQKAFWKRASDTVFSYFDSVEFPRNDWTDVRRHKWNSHLRLGVFDWEVCPFEVEIRSAIQEGEEVIHEHDSFFWYEDWSFDEVRNFLECQLPNLEALQAKTELWNQVQDKYALLQQAMGEGKKGFYFPAVLVLATKK